MVGVAKEETGASRQDKKEKDLPSVKTRSAWRLKVAY